MSGNYYFELEEHLQDHCIAVLTQKGIPCNKELYLNGLRADIVTPDAIIECKKVLTRDAIWQAYGQAREYADRTGKPRVIIVGQSPNSEKQLNVAMCTADQLQGKAEISFVDTDPYWQLQPEAPAWIPEYRPNFESHDPWDGPPQGSTATTWQTIVCCFSFVALIGMASTANRPLTVVDATDCAEFAGRGGCTAAVLRADPGGAAIGQVYNGTKIKVTGKSKDREWCQIQSSKDDGWVSCSLLR